jgi:hypothetical protein
VIRSTAVLIAVLSIAGVSRVYAQETSPGPGTVEVTVIPGGATFFTSGDHGTEFGNYNLGGALTYNINRIVGVEGEVVGSLGIAQDLQVGGLTTNQKPPNTLAYTGNVVLSLPTHSSFVPYVTGGGGGLTMFEKAGLGINSAETFLTGNAGGGVKWQAPDAAPAFFGQDTRYGHRVYGAVIINAVR